MIEREELNLLQDLQCEASEMAYLDCCTYEEALRIAIDFRVKELLKLTEFEEAPALV